MPTEQKKHNYVRKSFVADGKRYVVTGKTEQEAAEKLALKKEAVRRAELTTGANYTVEKWAETRLETYIKPKVRQPGAPKKKGTMTQKSYQMYEDKIYGYIIPTLKGRAKEAFNPLAKILQAFKDPAMQEARVSES